MRKILLLFMIFAMAFSVAASDFRFERITMVEPAISGEELQVGLIVENVGESDQEDVRVTAYIYDLDVRKSIRVFDLDDDEDISKRIALEIPEAESGLYLVRLSASDRSGNLRRVKHRWIEIA